MLTGIIKIKQCGPGTWRKEKNGGVSGLWPRKKGNKSRLGQYEVCSVVRTGYSAKVLTDVTRSGRTGCFWENIKRAEGAINATEGNKDDTPAVVMKANLQEP
ncbi:hypothetical protein BRC19_01200 [Candidatus Saccharibacteria bacterium QS_5_54_17]|nr:MAG: hypothetical protein BRC19_01200 [Candidatus Saccharibacteria bacterium QS_5_54_17]